MLLGPDLVRCRDALSAAERDASELERLAANAGGWWSDLIGASSAAAGVRANAKAARKLADMMAAEFDRLFQLPRYATPGEVQRFLEGTAAVGTGIDASREANRLGSVTGAVVEVGGGMASDAASVVGDAVHASANVGSVLLQLVRVGPYILAGLALVLLFAWGKRARARLGV